ncbi:CHAT domain-containing protein [Micromonospora matsumotoense]|uniref:CHAT domain-containing protein n=1 Tax=Micromonospora matsumotoense TaxID=121616 RepID=UPI0033C8A348
MSLRELDLTAWDVTGPWRWRWVLTDAGTGEPLAAHTVSPDPHRWEVDALRDLDAYLAWRAEPDRRVVSEAEIVARLGAFLAQEALGPAILAALRGADPVRLRIRVGEATFLTGLPWELADLDGLPLARHERLRVSFTTVDPAPKEESVGPLRMLAVFSRPTGTTALRLRSERQRLETLVTGFGRAVELEIVQWGVTREALAARLADGGGPDLLHVSGHGRHGRILLEGPAGEPDEIGPDELVALVRPARDRLRLAFLSACESGVAGDTADLGVRLAAELGCAVLAMRYPVTDDFAADLAETFYRELIDQGRDADAAASSAVRAAAGTAAAAARPALSLAAPVLIGPGGTRLHAPPVAPPVARGTGLPGEPAVFVGRDELMTLAGAALRPDSGTPVLLLTGMAGVGKTTCAVELAHRHRAGFDAVVFWTAPERDAGLTGGPAAFVDAIDPAAEGDPRRLLARGGTRRHLLVLDNAESLLTDGGDWRDPRWAELISALADRPGPTRLILTSRIPPATPTAPRVRQLEVGLLDGGEADALVRQLPQLRRLLHIDDEGPVAGHARDRALVAAIRAAAEGHPRLLELADAAANDPEALPHLLRADADDTLAAWTRQALDRLDPAPRLLLQVLAATEPGHRFPATVDHAWSVLGDGPPPLETLGRASLVNLHGDRYVLHPTVAALVRDDTPAELGERVDGILADGWELIARSQADRGDRETTEIVLAAHLAAVPYLLRQGRHARAAGNLNAVLVRDAGPRVARLARPLAEALAPGTAARDVLLGLAYQPIDLDKAERHLRSALRAGEDDTSAVAAGALANQLLQQGRLVEAAELAAQARHLGERRGPWTQAGSRLRQLLVQYEAGRSAEVLAEVTTLLSTLPDGDSGQVESVVPWAVREALRSLAVNAALALDRWQTALDHNGPLLDSVQRRGARETEVATHWLNDAAPLIRLGRCDEARKVLDYCQRVFAGDGDQLRLSRVFGTRALLASAQNDHVEAAALERTALRLSYHQPFAGDVATGHLMLGNHLAKLGTDPAGQLAHHLAAALLTRLRGAVVEPGLWGVIGADLHTYGQSWLPDDVAALSDRVRRVPGIHFLDLARSVAGDRPLDDELAALLDEVRREAEKAGFDVSGNLLRWDHRVFLIAAAAAGVAQAVGALPAVLETVPEPMAGMIRRICAGERDVSVLTDGVHPADVAVLRRILAAIAWREQTAAASAPELLAMNIADHRAAVDENDHLRAAQRAAELSGMLRSREDRADALRYAELAQEHTRRAGFGPWKIRLDLGRRLQLLGEMGRPEQVLAELTPLRSQLRGEPGPPTPTDPVDPSTVRESLWTLGQQAAVALGRWELALGFHEDRVDSAQGRGAGPADVAALRLDRVRCLIALGQRPEARRELDEIRPVLRRTGDPALLFEIDSYTAELAGTEAGEAEDADQAALVSAYRGVAAGGLDPRHVGRQHVLTGERFGAQDQPAREAAHLLAAALICALAGDADLAGRTVRHAAPHLYQFDGTRLTFSLDELVDEVERLPGVRFAELVTRRLGTAESAAGMLAGMLRTAYAHPIRDLFDLDSFVASMQEEIAAVLAARAGSPAELAGAERLLALAAEAPDLAPLVEPLRRVATGQPLPDVDQLTMHPVHLAVLVEVRSRWEAR